MDNIKLYEVNAEYIDYLSGYARHLFHTNLNLNICQIASGFFVMARRRFAGLLAASQGPTTKSWRKRLRLVSQQTGRTDE